jgi:hypothetical protein
MPASFPSGAPARTTRMPPCTAPALAQAGVPGVLCIGSSTRHRAWGQLLEISAKRCVSCRRASGPCLLARYCAQPNVDRNIARRACRLPALETPRLATRSASPRTGFDRATPSSWAAASTGRYRRGPWRAALRALFLAARRGRSSLDRDQGRSSGGRARVADNWGGAFQALVINFGWF